MVLNVNVKLLEKVDNISLNQLVLLSLVLDNNQNSNQDVRKIVSLLTDSEIQDLIDRNLITKEVRPRSVIYHPTKDLKSLNKSENDYFKELKEIYPTVVTRPDGTAGHLQSNIKRCETYYNKYVKGDESIHRHILDCLNKELQDRMLTGKLGYLKTLWNWLTSHEWENYEEQTNTQNVEQYGTRLL